MMVGQKVVCIDDTFPEWIGKFYNALPVKDTVYIVRTVSLGVNWQGEPGEVAITLNGLINPCSTKAPHAERAFNAERFRPLRDERIEEHEKAEACI